MFAYCALESAVDSDLVSLFDGYIAADSSVTSIDILAILFKRGHPSMNKYMYVGCTICAFLGDLHAGPSKLIVPGRCMR